MNIAQVLRDTMKQYGLTQAEVATTLNVPDSTVSRWLTGSIPHDKHLRGLAKLVELDLDEMTAECAKQRKAQRSLRAKKEAGVHRPTQRERVDAIEARVVAAEEQLRTLVELLQKRPRRTR